MARFDIAVGDHEVLGYGLPSPWRAEYIRLLRERYGIRFRTIALCIVSESLRAYADGYNGISTDAAIHRFGHDIFKECYQEARRKWEEERSSRKQE